MLDINELIKSSMKSGDKVALRAYKNLKAEIQKVKTAKNAKPYTDATEIQLISKMCKNLEEAILDFSKAHREDLVTDYTSELEVLKKLLPEPVNESQICSFIEKCCLNNNFVGSTEAQENIVQIPKKEMGKVIKAVKETYPQADGKLISSIVKKYVI
jgi:uncharacterized protein YqeY